MTSPNDVCDIDRSAQILGIDLEMAKDLCAAVGGDPERLTPNDLVEMADLLREEDEEDDDVEVCESCGKEEDADVVDSNWIMFGTGNDLPPVFAFVCPDCARSEEKMRKAFDLFLVALNRKLLS